MAFEWVPYLDGKHFTYQTYFGLTFASIFVAAAVALWVVSALVRLIGWLLSCSSKDSARKASRRATGYVDVEIVEPRVNSFVSSEENEDEEAPKKSFGETVIWIISSVFSWLSALSWAMVAVALMAFDIISPVWSICISLLILLNEYISGLYSRYPSATKKTTSKVSRLFRVVRIAAQNGTASMQLALGLILLFSVGATVIFKGTCISLFNYDDFWFYKGRDVMSWSSTFTRYISHETSCPPGPPCHLFATLPEDGSTGVIINVHTHIQTTNLSIYYEEAEDVALLQGKLGKNLATPRTSSIDTIETKGQRAVHITLLEGLTPNTSYYIQVYYNGQVQTSANYRTLPDKDHAGNMKIIQGGDAGVSNVSQQVMTLISQVDPDVVMIGGDLAYDNNIKHCYYTWDYFLNIFEDLNKRVGRLVPLVMTTGNHDVGLDDNAETDITIDEGGPWLFAWLAQSTKADPSDSSKRIIPAIKERKSYDYHLIGKILLMNLDSDYVAKFDGHQLTFLNHTSAQYPDYLKWATYHNPIYSSCRKNPTAGEQYWVPLFDHYRYLTVFENHVHSFKRTLPITNRQYNPQGTTYLGDGSWGITPSTCKPNNSTGTLAVFKNEINFFWLIEVGADEANYTAITATGNVLDNYSQNLTEFKKNYVEFEL